MLPIQGGGGDGDGKPAGSGGGGRKRRPLRSCETCRVAKVRCDRVRPACGRCRRLNRTCSLRPAPAAAAAAPAANGTPAAVAPLAGGGGGGPAMTVIPAAVSAAGDSVVQAHTNVDGLMGPRRFAEHLITSFLKVADHIVRRGHELHWAGSAPPPGPLPKVFLALGKWRHFQTYWGADYSWGLLQTITAVVGEPLFILPPPFAPVGPQGPGAQQQQQPQLRPHVILGRECPITCFSGFDGCQDAPPGLLDQPLGRAGLGAGAAGGYPPLRVLVADRATGAVAVHLSPAFEQLFLSAAEAQQYVEITRCLPLFALARVVEPQDLPRWSDAALQAFLLGDGDGMTSVVVRVRPRAGIAVAGPCLCSMRLVPFPEHLTSFFLLELQPIQPVAAAATAIAAAGVGVGVGVALAASQSQVGEDHDEDEEQEEEEEELEESEDEDEEGGMEGGEAEAAGAFGNEQQAQQQQQQQQQYTAGAVPSDGGLDDDWPELHLFIANGQQHS